jgi:hypothetical protein
MLIFNRLVQLCFFVCFFFQHFLFRLNDDSLSPLGHHSSSSRRVCEREKIKERKKGTSHWRLAMIYDPLVL